MIAMRPPPMPRRLTRRCQVPKWEARLKVSRLNVNLHQIVQAVRFVWGTQNEVCWASYFTRKNMKAKKPKYNKPTTNTQIRAAIRRLWLRCRERDRAKATMKECAICKAIEELEIHHINGIDWDRLFEAIREEILNDNLICLCKECHKSEAHK